MTDDRISVLHQAQLLTDESTVRIITLLSASEGFEAATQKRAVVVGQERGGSTFSAS